MKVLQIYMRNPLRNFNYIVYSEVNNKAIFIDPLDIDKTMPVALAKGLEPAWLLNTHRHHDHVKDNDKFLKATNAVHLQLDDGEKFFLSKREHVEALYTPGHTKDHFCYLLYTDGEPHSLISGDTLFNGGVGNCKNGGDVNVLYETIARKIGGLPEHLLVYPGHDYLLNNLQFAQTVEEDNKEARELLEKRKGQDLDNEFVLTTLRKEKEINPFLRLEKLKSKFKDKTSKEIFLELRSLRDQW
ncbi:MAG: hydroxyacylglutathione hydrolase C-terminal domain-containing protein [Bacteriovoracaceae bacterium]